MPSFFEITGGLIGAEASYTVAGSIEFVGTPVESSVSVSSINLPNGLQENDIVIVCGFLDGGSPPATPTGYTSIASVSDAADTSVSYKIMGATPDTTASGLTNADDCAYIAFALRYVDTTTPLDVTATTAIGGSGEPDPPSITPVSNNALILAIGHIDDDLLGTPNEPPTGYTSLLFGDFGVPGTGGSYAVAYKTLATAAAEDPSAFNLGSLTDDWNAITVALRPRQEIIDGGLISNGSGIFNLDYIYNKNRPAPPVPVNAWFDESVIGTPARTETTQGTTGLSTLSNGNEDYTYAVDIDTDGLTTTDSGILFEVGGGTDGTNVYATTDHTSLTGSVGIGVATSGGTSTVFEFDSYAGKKGTLYVTINVTSDILEVYFYDFVLGTMHSLGSITDLTGDYAGTDTTGFGAGGQVQEDTNTAQEGNPFSGTLLEYREFSSYYDFSQHI